MPRKQVSAKIRERSELQYVEIVGRLYACEHLENEFESIEDHRVLYGWNLLTQEVLIRLSEASLKLLHMIHSDSEPPRGHSLAYLWGELPEEVKQDVLVKRRDFPNGNSGIKFGIVQVRV